MPLAEPVDLSAFKSEYPAPPKLHWLWLVLLFEMPSIAISIIVAHHRLTSHSIAPLPAWENILMFLLSYLWLAVQLIWLGRVFPKSRIWVIYALYCVARYAQTALQRHHPPQHASRILQTANDVHLMLVHFLLALISGVIIALFFYANYRFGKAIQEHYNEAEPVGLVMSGPMSVIFGSLYRQYWFRKIAMLKEQAATPAPRSA